MSSKRFPGKVLAPFQGKPVIAHVVAAAARTVPFDHIVVTTSSETADDPLACYVRKLGIAVFRGELENVVARYQACLDANRCNWFFRLCADSPLIDSGLLQAAMRFAERRDIDLVTNVFPRTFPRGQSVELIKADTFAAIDANRLTPRQKEHATQIYYNHPERFKIVNLESAEARSTETSYAIDTLEDLGRLEHVPLPVSFAPKPFLQEVQQVA